MRFAILITLVPLTALVSGCATVSGPAGKNIRAFEACGTTLAEGPENCAPDAGLRMELDQRERLLTITTGVPNALNYLGTVVPKGDRTGNPGINCGSPIPANTPFLPADVVAMTPEPGEVDFRQVVEQEYTLTREFGANVQTSLKDALATAGVPPLVLDKLKGEIKAAAGNVRSVAAKARGTFSQYQLQPSLIREMQSDEVSARLAPCARMLAAGEWEMYQAVSGWYIDESTYASTETTRISAELAAKVHALDPNVSLATLEGKLNQVATQAVRTTQRPNFRIVGVSYFDPYRVGSSSEASSGTP